MRERPLGELVEVLDHKRVPVNRRERATREGTVPYYGATGQVGWIDDFLFDEELVLLGEDGVQFLDPLKPKAYVINGKSWVNNHAHVLRVRPQEVHPHFLCHALDQVDYRELVGGTTRLKLTKSAMLRISIPVPPIEEQRRIALRISEWRAEIERGEDLLTDVDAQFADFDAALLEAACLGHLLYPPSDHHGPYLPALPGDWEWVALADLAADEPRAITDGPFGSSLKSAHYTEEGPRVIRLQNIGEGVFFNAEAHVSPEHFETLRTHEAVAGDVVLAALGEILPRACVVPEALGPAIVKADCQRIRLRPEMNPHFAVACLNSRPVRDQAKARVHGVGRPRLRLADAKELRLPFPSRGEQDAVVARLKGTQVRGAALRATRDEALSKADGLKRSLLREAMSGCMR
jgi:type I restriction enzyme S subunit